MSNGPVESTRAEQAHNWWIKGLGGLINIGEQVAESFGAPRGSALPSEIARLQKLAGVRFTVSDELDRLVITDHKLQRMSWDGGQTWTEGTLGS